MNEIIAFTIFIILLYLMFTPLFKRKRAEMSLEQVLKAIRDLDGKAVRNKDDLI